MDGAMELDIVQSKETSPNKGPDPAVVPSLLCGLGSWRPSWLQWLANHYVYSVSFILIGIIQGMEYTYFNGVVTTVEKAFHVGSSTLGYVLAGNDISQILCGFILTHVASRGNKPFWMATGILIGALSCFLFASTQLFWHESSTSETTSLDQGSTSAVMAVQSVVRLCSAGSSAKLSNSSTWSCDAGSDGAKSDMLAAVWLFFGQFVAGIGGTATYSLGFAYMDDNIKKRNSPLYIGLASSMRSLGPTLGYLLSSVCLNIYINPSEVPEYESRDHRWLGAWWLGFLIIGILQTLFAFPILMFPKELPSRIQMATPATATTGVVAEGSSSSERFLRAKAASQRRPSTLKAIAGLVPTIKRLIRNPILVANMVSCVVVIPMVGVATFMPKYLEARFGQTASQANVLTGLTGQMMIMVGMFVGGVIIWKFKPRAVYVAGWTAVVDFLLAMAFVAVMNLDCNDISFEGIQFQDGRAQITSACSQACDCKLTFDPVCVDQRQDFLSPCLAGCTAIDDVAAIVNVTKNIFYNCSCGPLLNSVARSGFCEDLRGVTCPNLWIYLAIIAAAEFMVASTRTGCIMVIFRAVRKEDKGAALMMLAVAGSIFGFIPGPIIYGAFLDTACLLWETTSCGQKGGNCWFYDVEAFSHWFHGLAIFFTLITVVLDMVIAWNCRHLKLYEEDGNDDGCDMRAMRASVMATRSLSIKSGL